MRIAIEFDWEELGEVTLSPAGRLIIPSVPVEPGVYKFQVAVGSRSSVYIGQAGDLRRRMRNYAGTHTGLTNTRIRKLLLYYLQVGLPVRHAIVRRARVEIGGEILDADFSLGHVRLLIENAALAHAQRTGAQLHNL